MEEPASSREDLTIKEKTYKSFSKLIRMVLNLCFSSFYFGYALAYLGTFDFENIVPIFSITMDKETAQGLLNGCVPIGAGIGALSSSILLRKFSRRQSILIINAAAFLIGCLLLVPNLWLFFICRVIQGFCVGLYSAIIPLMINEFSPTEISGTLGVFNNLSIAFGVFFVYLLQQILIQISDQQDHWRIMFGFPLLTVAIQTLLLLFVYKYDTPRYLVEKGRQEKCLQVLNYIYKAKFVDIVIDEKRRQVNPQHQSVISEMPQPIAKPQVNKVRVILAVHLAVLQQFVGINAVIVYGSEIVSKVFPSLANLIPVFLNLEQIVGGLLSSYLLTKFGRKTLLQLGTVLAAFCLLIIALGFFIQDSSQNVANALIVIGLVIFMANFGLSLGPLVWLYIPEIVEPKIVPFSTLANWASATTVIILFPILKKALGTPAPLFLFFFIWTLLSFFFNWKYMVETRGKTQTQIFAEFKKSL